MVRVLATTMVMIGIGLATAHATRFGFEGFAAIYKGGYAIAVNDEGVGGGEARVRIRAARDGRSARVAWTNVFYTERGSYRVTLNWNFLRGGTFVANTLDARQRRLPGSGAFVLDGRRPVVFTATSASGAVIAEGHLKMIGGGALFITVTLRGLPEGVVTCTFNGGRL
jgi:hypothetical protein